MAYVFRYPMVRYPMAHVLWRPIARVLRAPFAEVLHYPAGDLLPVDNDSFVGSNGKKAFHD